MIANYHTFEHLDHHKDNLTNFYLDLNFSQKKKIYPQKKKIFHKRNNIKKMKIYLQKKEIFHKKIIISKNILSQELRQT